MLNNHDLQDHNYIASTPMGELQRNRQHLTQILDSENSDLRPEQTPQQEIIVPTESTSRSTTGSGHVSVPPNWLISDSTETHKTLRKGM